MENLFSRSRALSQANPPRLVSPIRPNIILPAKNDEVNSRLAGREGPRFKRFHSPMTKIAKPAGIPKANPISSQRFLPKPEEISTLIFTRPNPEALYYTAQLKNGNDLEVFINPEYKFTFRINIGNNKKLRIGSNHPQYKELTNSVIARLQEQGVDKFTAQLMPEIKEYTKVYNMYNGNPWLIHQWYAFQQY